MPNSFTVLYARKVYWQSEHSMMARHGLLCQNPHHVKSLWNSCLFRLQTLPNTTTHLLHQKTSPSARFNSPARSLPPYLRSYRSFTQTALLAMNSSQPEEVLAESVGQIPARRSGSMIRGSKSKGEALVKGRAVSAQPALR